MHVCCSAAVVAWEDTLERGAAVCVGGLETAEEGVVEVGEIVFVAVAGADDAAVDAGCVAVPEIPHEVFDGLAGGNIEELGVDYDVDSRLGFDDVGADVFTGDI